jgi:hypothetical protein
MFPCIYCNELRKIRQLEWCQGAPHLRARQSRARRTPDIPAVAGRDPREIRVPLRLQDSLEPGNGDLR